MPGKVSSQGTHWPVAAVGTMLLAGAAMLAISGCSKGGAEGAPGAAVAVTGTAPVHAGTPAGQPESVAAAESEPATAPQPAAPQPAAAEAAAAQPAPGSKIRDITFDTIKFPMEIKDTFHRKMLTPQIEALGGQKIRLRGYILPTPRQNISSFILVRDNKDCCFGPKAALYDCVNVEMDDGLSTKYTVRPVTVEGVFTVEILEDIDPNARPLAIYHLQAYKVK